MSKPISKARLLWGFGIFLVVWAIIGGMLMIKTANEYTARSYTQIEIQQISTALAKFHGAGGKIPDGDNFSVFHALTGTNSPQTSFFVPKHTNATGEVLDFWGTPYRIDKTGATNFSITSAGKNKTFGDTDDVSLAEPTK